MGRDHSPFLPVFNQVTLSFPGLNMSDTSHNTPGHLFRDLVPVLPAENMGKEDMTS